MEQLIFKSKLNSLAHLVIMNTLVVECFNKTGNKFSVEINGSKGYMDNITISCEGTQKEGANTLSHDDLFTENGRIRNKTISVFHSHENGVRVEI